MNIIKIHDIVITVIKTPFINVKIRHTKEIQRAIFKNVMNVNGGQRVYQDVEITIDHLHNYDPT